MAMGDFLARSDQAELEMMVNYYPCAILQAIFQPLQGMLNMLVFCRPKYLKWRDEYPFETKWWAFRRSIFGERIRPTIRERPASSKRSMEAFDEELHSEHFSSTMMEESKDKVDPVLDKGASHHTSGTLSSSFHSYRPRENVSTLTASVGDFDHVIDDGVADERWATIERSDGLTAWVPVRRSNKQSTATSGNTTRGSSLEVISERAESVFEIFPTTTSISNSVAAAAKNQQEEARTLISPGQKEGRWSPSPIIQSSPISPTGRIRAGGVLASRLEENSDGDDSSSLGTPANRWSSGLNNSSHSQATAAAAAIPLPRRLESLNDASSSSPPPTASHKSLSMSPPLSNGSSGGSSVSSASSATSSDAPPRRRLSPPPFANDDADDDNSDGGWG